MTTFGSMQSFQPEVAVRMGLDSQRHEVAQAMPVVWAVWAVGVMRPHTTLVRTPFACVAQWP